MAKEHGLSRKERLTKTGDFDRVFREGRRHRAGLFSVCYAPNGLGHSRLGVALPRGWGGAVARNRAKRLVREAFRTHKHELPKGVDLVVVPGPRWGKPGMAEVAGELLRLLPKAQGGPPG